MANAVGTVMPSRRCQATATVAAGAGATRTTRISAKFSSCA